VAAFRRGRRTGVLGLWIAVSASAALAAPVPRFDDAVALHTAGRAREALEAYRAIVASAVPVADRAAALNNACVLEGELGEHPAALADCEEALRLRRPLGDEAAVAETANNLGLAFEAVGRNGEAAELYREALAINRRLGDGESVVVNLGNLGALALAAGRYSEAMRLYRDAARLATGAGDAPWAVEQRRVARINEGVVLEKVGEYRQAVALYKQLLAEGGGDARQRAGLLVNAGVIYRNLDDAVSALAAFDEASAIYRRLGDRSGLSNVLLNRALALHLNLARPRAAEEAYRQALALARESGDRSEEVQDLFYLARLLLGRAGGAEGSRWLDEAEALFRQCLAVAERSGSAEGKWSAQEGLGRIAAARGDLRGALDRLEGALAEIERVRAGLRQAPWRAGYFGDKRSAYAVTVDVLARLHAREPGGGFDARAFGVVQRAKARDLLDRLGPARRPAEPRTAADVLARQGSDTVIEYFVGEGQLFRWVLDGAGIHFGDAVAAAPSLAAVARVHAALAGGGGPAEADLVALASALLPARLTLPRAGGQLRIAPDALLHYLPFELLRPPGERATLLELATLAYLPSSSTLATRAEPAGEGDLRLVAFAAPDASSAGGQPSLQAAASEVDAVAALLGGRSELFSGRRATEEAFREAVRRRPEVLHFATHATVEEPIGGAGSWERTAAIHLAAGGADDGLLTPPEIAAAGAASRLTVLAACRTGLVTPGAEGRTLASLTGSFLAAGTPAVVATLWDVDDRATALFMEMFYRELSSGPTPAAALRETKLRLRRDPRWDRPALWAAYVLVGDGEPLAPSRRWRLPVAALAILAGAALFWRSFRV